MRVGAIQYGPRMPQKPLPAPITYAVDQNAWPNADVVEAPLVAHYVRHIAARLDEHRRLHGLSYRNLADGADISVATVFELVNGNRWPDLRTVVALEGVLGIPLLPDWNERSKAIRGI